MSRLTPAQRSLRARVAALSRVTAPGYSGKAATEKARAAARAKLAEQVDPDGLLAPAELERRIGQLIRLRMLRGKMEAE